MLLVFLVAKVFFLFALQPVFINLLRLFPFRIWRHFWPARHVRIGRQSNKDEACARPLLLGEGIAEEENRNDNRKEFSRCRHNWTPQRAKGRHNWEDKVLAKCGTEAQCGQPLNARGVTIDKGNEFLIEIIYVMKPKTPFKTHRKGTHSRRFGRWGRQAKSDSNWASYSTWAIGSCVSCTPGMRRHSRLKLIK